MKKFLVPLVILLVFAFILAGCASSNTPAATTPAATKPTGTPVVTTPAVTDPAIPSPTGPSTPLPPTSPVVDTSKYGGTMRYITASGAGAPFGTPWLSTGASSFGMQFSLQFLLREKIDGTMEPLLAESWDIVTDPANPSITFHLRKGVKFHDGTDFNAQAVKWNLEMAMSPTSTNLGSTTNWKSLEVIDDYTFRVNLKTWQNTSVRAFADTVSYIASPAAYEKNGIEWMKWNMVGTGAFLQKTFERDVKMSFTRNPDYWEDGKPYLDSIEYLFVPDAMTAEALFRSGGGEILQSYSDLMTQKMQQAGYKTISIPGMGAALIPDSMNADSPWANPKFRTAVEYAIDKEAICKTFGYGNWEALYQAFPKSSPAYDPGLTPRKYDVAKAKQLMAEAGYPNGVKTNLYISPFGANHDLAVAIQAYLRTIGITLELQYPQTGAWSGMLTGTWRNGALFGPGPMALNPNSGWAIYAAGSAWYQSLKKPDGWAGLYTDSVTAPQLDVALAQKCEAALYNDVTTIPLWVAPTSWIVTDNVQDSGLGTRGLFAWFESQDLWLSK